MRVQVLDQWVITNVKFVCSAEDEPVILTGKLAIMKSFLDKPSHGKLNSCAQHSVPMCPGVHIALGLRKVVQAYVPDLIKVEMIDNEIKVTSTASCV